MSNQRVHTAAWRRTAPAMLVTGAMLCAAAGERLAPEDYAKLFRGAVRSADAGGNVSLAYDFASAEQHKDFEGVPAGAAGKLRLSLFHRPVWLRAHFEGDVALDLDVATRGGPGAIHVLVDPETEAGYVFLFGVDFAPSRSMTAVGMYRRGKPPEVLYVGQRGAWAAGDYTIRLSREGGGLEMSIDGRLVIKTTNKTHVRGRIGFSGDLTISRLQVRSRVERAWRTRALSAVPEIAAWDDFHGLVGVKPGFRLARDIPEWGVTHEHKTVHYVVTSNANPELAVTWARMAEKMDALYAQLFPPPRKDAGPARIVIFASRAEFVRFGAPAQSLGFYWPRSRVVYLFDHRNPDVTCRVLLHEGFRQYLHRYVSTPPAWVEQGAAQYFEMARWNGATFTAGAPGPRLRVLARLMKQGRSCELPEFLSMDATAFWHPLAAGRNHACAAGLVHFLLHGAGGAHRQRMVMYIGALMEDAAGAAAYDRALGTLDWNHVKPQWFDYIAELQDR